MSYPHGYASQSQSVTVTPASQIVLQFNVGERVRLGDKNRCGFDSNRMQYQAQVVYKLGVGWDAINDGHGWAASNVTIPCLSVRCPVMSPGANDCRANDSRLHAHVTYSFGGRYDKIEGSPFELSTGNYFGVPVRMGPGKGNGYQFKGEMRDASNRVVRFEFENLRALTKDSALNAITFDRLILSPKL